MLMLLPGGHVGRRASGCPYVHGAPPDSRRSEMSVAVEALFTSALGLTPPWIVESVNLDNARRRIDFQIACSGAGLACPACGAADQRVHDRLARSWRHLDFFQFEAWLH